MEVRILFMILLAMMTVSSFSQLTEGDKNYIKAFILSGQSSKTGLFFESTASTYKAAEVFRVLKEKVPNTSSICKELSYDAKDKTTIDLVELDSLLDCKIDYSNSKIDTDLAGAKTIQEFYEKLRIANLAKKKISYVDAYSVLSSKYLSKNKFSYKAEGKAKSIYATAIGLDCLYIIYGNVKEKIQENIKKDITGILNVLQSSYQEMSDDIAVFSEKRVSMYKLNSAILKSFELINHIVPVPKYEELQRKMLNYFLTFKYEIFSLDNIYYLSTALSLLQKLPIISIEETKFDYLNDKTIDIKFVNSLGKEIKLANSTLTYEVKSQSDKKKQKKSSSYDLDDEAETPKQGKTKKSKELSKATSKVALELSDMIVSPGSYSLTLTLSNKVSKLSLKKTHTVKSISKIKISNIKLSVENSDKTMSEKETQIDYPKRSFRNIKANQDSVLRLKVKLSYGDKQATKPAQLFLRLKHVDLGKVFSAYSNDYNEREDYYSIDFAMDDPVNMESFNGNYELALVVSDASLDQPIVWNFGTMEITFRKPSDPETAENYKNKMKPKMEPTFTQEVSLHKNFGFSMIFCGIIIALIIALFAVLNKSGVNMDNFPRGYTGKLYNVFFILLMLLFAYVLVFFWLKLNILQTLGIFTMLFIPGGITLYKAMKNVKIDI